MLALQMISIFNGFIFCSEEAYKTVEMVNKQRPGEICNSLQRNGT